MDINFHPSAQETGNGNSFTFQQSDLVLVGLFVNVTEIAGVLPSLTVTLQHSPDGVTWYNVGTIAVTRTSTGASSSTPAALAMLADYIQISWTFSGTSCTFTADVVAHNTLS